VFIAVLYMMMMRNRTRMLNALSRALEEQYPEAPLVMNCKEGSVACKSVSMMNYLSSFPFPLSVCASLDTTFYATYKKWLLYRTQDLNLYVAMVVMAIAVALISNPAHRWS